MTKIYIFLTIAIIIILAICIGSLYFLHISADNISYYFNDMEKAIKNENWPQAENYFTESANRWQKYQKLWPIFIDHSKTGEINLSFIALKESISYQNAYQSHQNLQELRYRVQQVPEAESLSWENIF